MHTHAPDIKSQLAADEHLLWSGQPRQGLLLRASDAYAIPFSLLWGGFALFWESSVIATNAPPFFVLWGIPFVLVGLYIIIGRFFVDARLRAHTRYAVTDQRVLIVSGLFKREVRSLPLTRLPDLILTEGRRDEGSINFGPAPATRFNGMAGWPGQQQTPGFELIADARRVYNLIQDVQRPVQH
ncbi:PH domain-containing protein [Andreprevotia lacus DSM 23236]|jgi:hypothetical protein|uniref:PH domain-containing protein n=1 Tax=Andreprevotia lacus DSM 23236 TaxID=1121001 RepID=A0A1W1XYY1_9NEIS|nr:PH domain-containing protein [Andreprevotia lacus]SMC29085.1 PH domain-containing protein [Andreprevotia lacus DSM 23236]